MWTATSTSGWSVEDDCSYYYCSRDSHMQLTDFLLEFLTWKLVIVWMLKFQSVLEYRSDNPCWNVRVSASAVLECWNFIQCTAVLEWTTWFTQGIICMRTKNTVVFQYIFDHVDHFTWFRSTGWRKPALFRVILLGQRYIWKLSAWLVFSHRS